MVKLSPGSRTWAWHISNVRNPTGLRTFFCTKPHRVLVSVFADSLENGKFHGFSGKKAFHDWRKHWRQSPQGTAQAVRRGIRRRQSRHRHHRRSSYCGGNRSRGQAKVCRSPSLLVAATSSAAPNCSRPASDRSRGDDMGMLGTVMNCLALQDFLEQEGRPRACKPPSPWDRSPSRTFRLRPFVIWKRDAW